MSIASIVQIAERLLSGNVGKEPQDQGKNQIAQASTPSRANRTEFGDRFTPSEQTDPANAAGGTGVFQAEQLRLTALNLQTPAGNTATTTAAAPPTTKAAPANAVLNAAVAPVPTIPAAPATPPVTAAAQPAATATTASVTQTQQDLQTLNSALTALGLNATENAAFDQYAGILLQFEPNALQDLESQLNLLAAQYATQNASASAVTPASAATPPATAITTPAAAGVAPTAAGVTPGFQLSELSISFTGVNETLNRGAQNGGNSTTTQFSAFSLQVQEVRVSLTNAAGQTTQLQVPQATGTSAAATIAPVAQAATA